MELFRRETRKKKLIQLTDMFLTEKDIMEVFRKVQPSPKEHEEKYK